MLRNSCLISILSCFVFCLCGLALAKAGSGVLIQADDMGYQFGLYSAERLQWDDSFGVAQNSGAMEIPSEDCLALDDFVRVGNIYNVPNRSGVGTVVYEYEISRLEVTNCAYAYFLNDVARWGDPYMLYDDRMDVLPYGGIHKGFDLSRGVAIYSVPSEMKDKPVNFVSWNSAARFTNWLQNRGIDQSQLKTEYGAYEMRGYFPYGYAERSDRWMYALPSADEWYKAAYYDPTKWQGSHYWKYATRSDQQPGFDFASQDGDFSNPGSEKANYNRTSNWRGSESGNVVSVGSTGIDSASYYGTQDMNGNVSEWTEEVMCIENLCGRFFMGGDMNSNYAEPNSHYVPGLKLKTTVLQSSEDGNDIYRYWRTGFRVVKRVLGSLHSGD